MNQADPMDVLSVAVARILHAVCLCMQGQMAQ